MTVIRSTYNGRLAMLVRETQTIASRQANAQVEATSGLRLERPSDDPGRISTLHRVRAHGADQEVWQRNASLAYGVQYTADQALDGMSDVISRARELAVRMSSETYNDSQRELSGEEAENMLSELVRLGNTNNGGRYVFGGDAYDTEPFQSDGTYQGGDSEPGAPVGEGLSVASGFVGDDLIQDTGDPLAAVTDLITALQSGDADQVAASLGGLDDATDQISTARTKVGFQLRMSEDAQITAESMQTEMTRQASEITDADSVESYSRLFEVQTAYTAALQVLGSSKSSKLFDYM